MIDREVLFADFCTFAKAQLESGDIDPMYPVLARFYKNEELSEETALWRTLLYLAWYHVGSAEKVWKAHPEPKKLMPHEVIGLPTGVERRGFRGNMLAATFINGVQERARTRGGTLRGWVMGCGLGEGGWEAVRSELEQVAWAGPWASYKWADLLKHVHGIDITASDIGVGGKGETAGPIPGMVRLTGEPWQECANNRQLQKRLLGRAKDAGVPFNGLDQLETALCDFNSLCKGGYYVGHDVDGQMSQLESSGAGLWEAREVFDHRYRGECAQPGWFGVRKPLKTVYAKTGKVWLPS